MQKQLISLCLCILAVCSACEKGRFLMPTSGGRAYEVLIVGADTDAVNIIAEGLRSLEMAALPQAEKTFDVSVI